jgi:hypothetical protein
VRLVLTWQARSLGHGLKFLGYFGLLDHPTFTKAIRHLPVHEITSTPHLLSLLPPSEHASLGWRSDPCVGLSVCCVAQRGRRACS